MKKNKKKTGKKSKEPEIKQQSFVYSQDTTQRMVLIPGGEFIMEKIVIMKLILVQRIKYRSIRFILTSMK